MAKALCIGDPHVCPGTEPNGQPHVGGPVAGPGARGVRLEGRRAALKGDKVKCVGRPDAVDAGLESVFIEGKPVADSSALSSHGGAFSPLCSGVYFN